MVLPQKIFLAFALTCAAGIQNASGADILHIYLAGNASLQVPVENPIEITPIMGNWLAIGSVDLALMIQQDQFKGCRLLTLSDVEALATADAPWSVTDMSGLVLAEGRGVPDFSGLPRQKVMILRQNGMSTKMLLK